MLKFWAIIEEMDIENQKNSHKPDADTDDALPKPVSSTEFGKDKSLRERIWVTAGIKKRLEEIADTNGVPQERVLADVLDFYELATAEDLQIIVPELELSVSVLNIEVARLSHVLGELEAAMDAIPMVEKELLPLA